MHWLWISRRISVYTDWRSIMYRILPDKALREHVVRHPSSLLSTSEDFWWSQFHGSFSFSHYTLTAPNAIHPVTQCLLLPTTISMCITLSQICTRIHSLGFLSSVYTYLKTQNTESLNTIPCISSPRMLCFLPVWSTMCAWCSRFLHNSTSWLNESSTVQWTIQFVYFSMRLSFFTESTS